MAGRLTRLAAILRIPILARAVFIVNASQNLASTDQSLELAVMVLVLLIVYFFFGTGGFSLDQYLADKKTASKN